MWRIIAFMAGLAAALGALVAHGGRFDARLDLYSHFAPVWFAGGVLAFVIWLFLRPRGRTVLVVALIAISAAAGLMAPEVLAPRARAVSGEPSFKVIQFNVWGRNETWARAARWLMAENADVVVLEEFKPGRDLPPGWRRQYPYVTTCGHPAPCETVIFSRHRPIAQHGLEDGTAPFLSAAWATLDAPGGPVTVVAAHYTRPNDPALIQAQSARLAGVVRELPRERMIVSGDFNLTPWSALLRRQDRAFGLQRVTRAMPTWPGGAVSGLRLWTPFPLMPIDHVYVGPGWQIVDVERGPKMGSDHYPVVVRLTSAPRAPSPVSR